MRKICTPPSSKTVKQRVKSTKAPKAREELKGSAASSASTYYAGSFWDEEGHRVKVLLSPKAKRRDTDASSHFLLWGTSSRIVEIVTQSKTKVADAIAAAEVAEAEASESDPPAATRATMSEKILH